MPPREVPTLAQVAGFWDAVNPQHAHFREYTFPDWWRMWVRRHRDMLTSLAIGEIGAVLEWGVGGGANALIYPHAVHYGVDVSQRSLDEAAKLPNVVPLLMDGAPADVLTDVGPCDVFICTAVVQHMPSHEAVSAMLHATASKMRPGAGGLVQTRGPMARSGDTYDVGWMDWLRYSDVQIAHELEDAGWSVVEQRHVTPDYTYSLLRKDGQ